MATTRSVERRSREGALAIISKLQRDSFDDLDLVFEQGTAPSFDEIEGDTAGGLLAWHPQAPWWSKPLGMVCFDNPLSRWAGKAFIKRFSEGETGEGLNRFHNRIKPRRFPFVTRIESEIAGQSPCLTLDYCRFPGTLFSTRDELRTIEDGVFLGRAYSKLPWDKERWFLRYFVLCALSKSD